MIECGRIVAAVGLRLVIAGLILVVPGAVTEGIATAAGKQLSYPEGKSGELAQIYIDTFGSGVDSLMAGFFDSHLSEAGAEEATIKQRLWEYRRLYNLLGELTPYEVVKNDTTMLVVLVKSEKLNTWFHVNLEMDELSPGKLLDVDLQPAGKPK